MRWTAVSTSLVALAACAAPDAPGNVAVDIMRNPGRPRLPDIAVAFAGPDGVVTAIAHTDVTHSVSGDVLPGGSVTAVYSPATPGAPIVLQSILDVEPGDKLTLIEPSTWTPTTTGKTFTVEFTALAGADRYQVVTACGDQDFTAPPAAVAVTTACDGGIPSDVLIVAYQGQDVVGYVRALAVALVGGRTMVLSDPWATPPPFTASYSDIDPGEVSGIEVDRFADSNGVTSGSAAITASTADIEIAALPAANYARMKTIVTGTNARGVQVVELPVAGDSPDRLVDVGAQLLPWVGRPTLDPAGPAIDVPLSEPYDLALVAATVRYSHGGTDFVWHVVGPDGAMALPTLSGELAADAPTAGDTVGPGWAAMVDGARPFRQMVEVACTLELQAEHALDKPVGGDTAVVRISLPSP